VVYVWGAVNDRVLKIAEIKTNNRSGMIEKVRLYDNTGADRPSLPNYRDGAVLQSITELIDTSSGTYEYEIRDRNGAKRLLFEDHTNTVVIRSPKLGLNTSISFLPDTDGFTACEEGRRQYVVAIEPSAVQFSSSDRKTIFEYRHGSIRRIVSRYSSGRERIATVTGAINGHYIIEMPPYGDPGEFSHRIEIWTDRPSRGTLRSAAINSYLLPAGTFDFIFPFFAPTPQEVFEQAAAGE
jgi:hypothetical protein